MPPVNDELLYYSKCLTLTVYLSASIQPSSLSFEYSPILHTIAFP